MTIVFDDKRSRVVDLCHSARMLEGDEQKRFLDRACGSDLKMRREIEALLQHRVDTLGVLERPAIEPADEMTQLTSPPGTPGTMGLNPGTLLGPYRIEEALAAGGMGEVLRATDTRLHRTVAIKVLPHEKMSDPDRKRRFLQEARAASALNHPNIVTIYARRKVPLNARGPGHTARAVTQRRYSFGDSCRVRRQLPRRASPADATNRSGKVRPATARGPHPLSSSAF